MSHPPLSRHPRAGYCVLLGSPQQGKCGPLFQSLQFTRDTGTSHKITDIHHTVLRMWTLTKGFPKEAGLELTKVLPAALMPTDLGSQPMLRLHLPSLQPHTSSPARSSHSCTEDRAFHREVRPHASSQPSPAFVPTPPRAPTPSAAPHEDVLRQARAASLQTAGKKTGESREEEKIQMSFSPTL